MPVTIPVTELMDAVKGGPVLQLHAPVPGGEVKVIVAPGHTLAIPKMTDGSGLTVMVFVAIHPAPGPTE